VGDVNGDGYEDILITNSETNSGINSARAYILYGKNGNFGSNVMISTFTSTNGYYISGFEIELMIARDYR
jgi:FG-GAP repeat